MSDKLKILQQRHIDWINIVNRGDAEAYAGLLTEDAVWFPPGSDPIEGREAFKEWLGPFLSRYNYDFSIGNERFRVMVDRAITKGKFTSLMTPKEGGEPMQHIGTFIVLWHREGDDWYIERYIDDTDL